MKRFVTPLICLLLVLSMSFIQFEAEADIQKPPLDHFTLPPVNVDHFTTPTPTLIKPTKSLRTINPDLFSKPTPTKPTPAPTKPSKTKPPVSTEKPATGQNICSMGLYFREMRPILTDEWYLFTPVELNYDGIQVYPLIASNSYEVGELTLTIENGQLLAEYWVIDGIKILDEFLTFFPNLDNVKTVNVKMLGGQKFLFNSPIDIAENFGDDNKVILYMNNAVKFNNTVVGLKRFVVDNYRPWMWEIMNLLD